MMATATTPPFPVARFSVDQYHRLVASGVLGEDDRLELIEGWVVQQMAKGPAHEYATGTIDNLLRALVPAGFHVRNQAPITLTTSEPEPDVSIARGERGAYRSHHPGASDIVLVIEVADTSLETDRIKARTYARAGIPAYWLIDLGARSVEVYSQPGADGYRARQIVSAGALPLVIDGRELGSVALASFLA